MVTTPWTPSRLAVGCSDLLAGFYCLTDEHKTTVRVFNVKLSHAVGLPERGGRKAARMPIKIPDKLPARTELEDEGVEIITRETALRQDVRPLKILLLNLMPKKKETEIQFARLLSNTPLQIELTLMTTASYQPQNTSADYLLQFYRRLSDVQDEFFDGLIVTGAPIETIDFEKVDYWSELTEIIDWSDENPDLCDQSGSEDPSLYTALDSQDYERKHAPFDSLEELFLVSGITDDFWSTFVDPNPDDPSSRLMTIWGKGRININTAPPFVLYSIVCDLATDESGIGPCSQPDTAANVLMILSVVDMWRKIMLSGGDLMINMLMEFN